MIETIHFYHTNDLHSHFTYWPRIHEFVTTRKKRHIEKEEAVYTFDIGDHLDRSHIFTEGTLGRGNIDLLNNALYDAVTIGNNEGITMSYNELSNVYKNAKFDVIVGNLLEENGDRPLWLKPFTKHVTSNGTRIGILAVTAEYPQLYNLLGWNITPAFDELAKAIEKLEKEVDVLVCLSHLGIREDEKMAMLFPQIDVIFGAHTHHILYEGKVVNESLLAAAGKFGYFVGYVSIQFDHNKKEVVYKKATLYDTKDLVELKGEGNFVDHLNQIGQEKMTDILFHQNESLKKEWFTDSLLADFFGEALVAYCKADCALFNAGLFLRDLPKGWISSYEVHQMLPHPINPCVIELKADELIDLYNQSLNEDWPNLELKGLGFRGSIMGKMIAHKIRVENNRLFINNELVQKDKNIRLATLDMFTFGYFFPSLKEADKTYFMPDFIRDVFIWYGKLNRYVD